MRPGRPKKITDAQLRAIDSAWAQGVPVATAARGLGLKPKAAHNALYKLRMRRELYGATLESPRTIRW